MKKKMNLSKKTEISFISSNKHKYQEIKAIFEKTSEIQVKHIQKHLNELQSDNLEKIAIFSLKTIFNDSDTKYYFVEDSGLFIKSLNGFPGPYSSYIFKKLGNEGILKIMRNIEVREAYFQSTIALKSDTGFITFTGVIRGHISEKDTGSGWGYDPIFIVDSEFPNTLGDLGKEKDTVSHRYHATRKLIKYLENDPNFYKF
ncbi:MAG: non-canonical purine NTP pyrophosphatase [Candidatus Heimdallarchaeota archaeon]|nr:non-canonical purine NTP pyrophosphatase [Candidatus Heimdallarchaeota archaeon]